VNYLIGAAFVSVFLPFHSKSNHESRKTLIPEH